IRSGVATPRPFEVTAQNRHFRVTAKRSGNLALLWFIDVTAEHEDLTSRDDELERLARENRDFRQIVEALPFPLWRRGGDLELAWVNAAYVQAVEGRSANDVLHNATELVGNLVRGGPRQDAARALAEGA